MLISTKNIAVLGSVALTLAVAGCDPGGDGGAGDGEIPSEAVGFIPLPGDALFPEGIVLTPGGDLLVTGFGDGSIVRVSPDDHSAPFKASGEDGLSSAVGMAIDAERGRVWVANFSFDTLTSNLKVFDLEDGELVATVSPSGGPDLQFFNELTIDADGRVYVSDTLNPNLWTAGPALDGAEVFVEDPRLANPERPFGLNGLALSPDGRTLVASVMDRITQGGGRLVRVDVETRAVREVELDGALAVFGGSDGMFFAPGGELLMVNVTPPAALVTASFDDDYETAHLVERGSFDEFFDRPTSSAIRGDQLVVVGSQLDHVVDDENGALGTPPELPFLLTTVPKGAVLGD